MDLLRFDTTKGALYIDARAVFVLQESIEGHTGCQALMGGGAILEFEVATDVEEFAQQLERSFAGCRIHNVA